MNQGKLRLEGVYNDLSLKLANENRVEHLTLDFRPRSFNFIPIHDCLELLKTWKLRFKTFRALFSSDSELVVSEIIQKLIEELGDKVSVEFSEFRDDGIYRTLSIPFFSRAQSLEEVEQVVLNPLLKGIVIEESFLKNFDEKKELESFLAGIKRILQSNARGDVSLEAHGTWDDESFLSSLKMFDSYTFILSPSVEERYRVISCESFNNKLKKAENNLSLS